MKIDSELVGREVIVWPKRGEGFVLCMESPEDGIIPALTNSENGQNIVIAPFLKGKVEKLGESFVIKYKMPSGTSFFTLVNEDVIASVTVADPANPKKSSLIVGIS